MRERAVTLGRIADIITERGRLAEALRIRREEELPVHGELERRIGKARGVVSESARVAMQITDL